MKKIQNKLALAVLAGLSAPALAADVQTSDSQENEENQSMVLNEVVVEALRYEQKLNDVPMSISVLTEDNIEELSIESSDDILKYTPGAYLSGDGSFLSFPTIRGIGAGINNVEQSIAVYVDDVYQGAPRSFGMSLIDLERVEVLRGPQGALYGRNALGGAIKYIEKEPGPDFAGTAEIGIGNQGYKSLKIGVDVPLVEDVLYSRIAIGGRDKDGFINNALGEDLGGYTDKAARIKLLGFLSDDLEVDTNFHWTEERSGTAHYFSDSNVQKDPSFDLEKPFFLDKTSKGVDLKVNYSGDGYDLSSITAYNDFSLNADEATGIFQPFPPLTQWVHNDHEQISQEFRITNNDSDDFKWTAGVFLYKANEHYENGSQFGTGSRMTSLADNKTTSYAIFANVDKKITPNLSIDLGGRLTHDKKEGDYRLINGGTAFLSNASGELSKTNFSPRIGFSYKMTEDANLFGSVSRGYKAGGFNVAFISPEGEHEYKEETSLAYELGVKNTFLDKKLGISTAVFYTDWKNQQLLEYTGATADIVNVDKSKTYGAEVELSYSPNEDLNLGLGLSYTKANFVKYDSIVDENSNADGNQLPNIPKLGVNLNATYKFDWQGGKVVLHGDATYQSKVYFDAANTYSQKPYALVNLKLGYEKDNWAAYLWMNNAFDKLYRQTGHVEYGENMAVIGEPRTFGVKFKYAF